MPHFTERRGDSPLADRPQALLSTTFHTVWVVCDTLARTPSITRRRVSYPVSDSMSCRRQANEPPLLPLSFLQYPFQRFHAERLKGGVLVEGELSQLPV